MVKKITARETLELRHKVLRPTQTIQDCIYPLDDAEGAGHFAYLKDGKIISIASVYLESREGGAENSWRLRGMATSPELQGKGYGGKVLRACQDYVRDQKGFEIWCNARTTASGFYFGFGFQNLTPDSFDIPGIGPHYMMSLPIGERK